MKVYDTIIIGAGAAGMTASIYLSRYKVSHLIFGEVVGGQFVDATVVENYPGFTSIPGPNLAQAFQKQVESYGIKIQQEKITAAKKEGNLFLVEAERGKPYFRSEAEKTEPKRKRGSYKARSLILATGRRHRHLEVPGEEKLSGKGVSYCATCDAPLFKGKTVAVVGGGNAALTSAIHSAAFAKKVYLIHRRDQYRADPIWVERMRGLKNIEEVLSRQVKEIRGERSVAGVVLDNPFKGKKVLAVQGIFVEIGFEPVSELARMLGVRLDERGCIKINPDHSTNIPGIFAAGDITHLPGGVSLNQIVNSTGEGAGAAAAAYQYLCQLEPCQREE